MNTGGAFSTSKKGHGFVTRPDETEISIREIDISESRHAGDYTPAGELQVDETEITIWGDCNLDLVS